MNSTAPVYDLYRPLLGDGLKFRQATLRHAAVAPEDHVFDVGCGTGVLTRLAALTVGER